VQYHRYRRRQRRLTMIYMTNRTNVEVRLRPLKLLLCHWCSFFLFFLYKNSQFDLTLTQKPIKV